jgi:hypothetical protein
MPPSRRRSPLEYSRGVRPSQEAKHRPHGKRSTSPAGDLTQLLNHRISSSEGCEVALDLLDAMLKLLDLAEHLGQQGTDRCGQFLRGLCKIVGDASARDPHAKGNCDAKLAQQSSKGVADSTDAGR